MELRSQVLRRILVLTALFAFVWLFMGCAVTTKLGTDLSFKRFYVTIDEVIGLYVPDSSKKFVWNGNINVLPYHVEFGNALEPNAKHALSRVFREVVLIDRFPPEAGDFAHAVSVEIEDANVSPGALTFLSTSAQLRLKAVIAHGGKIDGNTISVQGRANESPNSFTVSFQSIQTDYNATLQRAVERAMTQALEKLVDAISEQGGYVP